MRLTRLLSTLMILLLCISMVSASADSSVIDTIMSAGTTQAFTMDAVSEADLNAILKAGLNAASAINQQPWYFAVVTNQSILAEISGGGMGAPSGMPAGITPPAGMEAPSDADATPNFGMPEGMGPSSGSSSAAKAGLGDSPVAIIIYANPNTPSPNASFDCGLACQNMVIAAHALGYGTKIISSPTNSLNGAQHDYFCGLLNVDASFQAVAVLLVGYEDMALDAGTSASVRNTMEEKVSFIK